MQTSIEKLKTLAEEVRHDVVTAFGTAVDKCDFAADELAMRLAERSIDSQS